MSGVDTALQAQLMFRMDLSGVINDRPSRWN